MRVCNAHYLRAKRGACLDELLASLPPRFCEQCGEALPLRARSTQRYCNKACANSAQWANCDRQERSESARAWRESTRADRLDAARASRAGRSCEECGTSLSPDSWRRKRFCSRRCVNQKGMREQSEQRRLANRRRRARLRSASGEISQRDWRRVVHIYRERCAYCESPAPLTMDHVIPLSRGGTHSIGNIVPACRSCNASKKHLLLADWRRRILPGRPARSGATL